jgi:uncharacterized integral membrane protein
VSADRDQIRHQVLVDTYSDRMDMLLVKAKHRRHCTIILSVVFAITLSILLLAVTIAVGLVPTDSYPRSLGITLPIGILGVFVSGAMLATFVRTEYIEGNPDQVLRNADQEKRLALQGVDPKEYRGLGPAGIPKNTRYTSEY